MFSVLVDLRYALQAVVRVRSSWIARVWYNGILDVLLYVACVSPAWSTVNVERMPFDDAARVTDRELLLNGTGLRSVFAIKGYVVGLYLSGHAKNTAIVLGMKGLKRLQTHSLCNVGADIFIHASNDGIHRNQTKIQMRKLVNRLTQLGGAMCQIDSTKRGDTINSDYTSDIGTTISINDMARTKVIPGENFYQTVPSIFIGNNPMDRELKNGLLGN